MIGRKLRNRYEIREHLGDGSTATVYKAHDERLGREVAIKLLLPHVRETTRKRFFQEANAAAQLNHPNIMALYDIDEEDERHFLVTEYVDGLTLTSYIPASAEMVVNLGVQIARALHYAHEREIIHRDIKPANIKVTTSGMIKIMDLGLALPREAKRVTAHGMVIGTPAYLSPEQAQGQKLDSRTDIYSLGIVLYEMITGQLPFNADDIGALLLQQVKQPPPPPRLMIPDLPVELEGIILKALEKNPVRRFQTAGALAEALEVSLSLGHKPASNDVEARPEVDTMQSERPSGGTPWYGGGKRTTRLVLADDHTLLRKTLANLLETREEFVVVAEAGDGDAALKQTLAILPDVLVLDLNMPVKGGLEILPSIRRDAPSVKVLVLTGREEDAYIVRALRAGAHGYVLKSADENELVEAITKIMQGQMYLGRGVAEKVVSGLLVGGGAEITLSDEENRLLLYIAAGYENDQIAKVLEKPVTTVIEMLARVLNKMGAKDRYSAALMALRQGLILIEDLHHLTAS